MYVFHPYGVFKRKQSSTYNILVGQTFKVFVNQELVNHKKIKSTCIFNTLQSINIIERLFLAKKASSQVANISLIIVK